MVDLLSKIICRSSDKPLKSDILTFRRIISGKFRLSAGKCAKNNNFPWILSRTSLSLRRILRNYTPFPDIIHGKFLLFAHFPAEKHAFPQDNSRKVKTSRVSYRNYPAERHAFPQESVQKVKTRPKNLMLQSL
jgi:hypothetical protein